MQKILYIDMDNVLVDFPSARDRLAEAGVWEQFEGNQDEIPDVFSLMDPMPGAIAAYEQLSGLFDTYVLSTAPWEKSHGLERQTALDQETFGHLCLQAADSHAP